MQTTSAGFKATVDGVDYTLRGRFVLTRTDGTPLDLTRCLQSLDLSAQMNTDLPDEARTQDGLSTAAGTVTLAGTVNDTDLETQHVAWLLNTDNPDSPMYRDTIEGCTFTFDLGILTPNGWEDLRQITGRIFQLDEIDHVAGTIAFSITDGTGDDDWDTEVSIPPVITVDPYNAGLTSEFPMDLVARCVYGDSTWPATRSRCVFAAGMRSSVAPLVGNLIGTATPPSFAPGKWGSALVGAPGGTGCSWRFGPASTGAQATIGIAFYCEFTISNAQTSSPILLGPGAFNTVDGLNITVYSNKIVVSAGTSDTWTKAVGTGFRTIKVAATLPAVGSSTITGTVYLDDGTSHAFTITMANPRVSPAWNFMLVSLPAAATIEAVQFTGEPAPVIDFSFVPRVHLDPSLNPMQVVPEISAGTKAFTALQTMAEAELGLVRRDEYGDLWFTNRVNLLTSPIVKTITPANGLKALTTSGASGVAYTSVQVGYTDWDFSNPGIVWQLAGKKRIPAGQTVTWTETLPQLSANIPIFANLLDNGEDNSDGGAYYRSALTSAGHGAGPALYIALRQSTPGTLTITVRNTSSSQDAWLVCPDTYSDTHDAGDPALWIGGITADPMSEATVTVPAGADATRQLSLTGNEYRQDPGAATDVGNVVLQQMSVTMRNFTGVEIRPRPDVQIADKLGILDRPGLSQINEYATVWGRSLSLDLTPGSESISMTLDMRALAPPGGWIGGVPGRSEGNLTTYGA